MSFAFLNRYNHIVRLLPGFLSKSCALFPRDNVSERAGRIDVVNPEKKKKSECYFGSKFDRVTYRTLAQRTVCYIPLGVLMSAGNASLGHARLASDFLANLLSGGRPYGRI